MRATQRDNIRRFFKENPNKFLPLYQITAFAAQYGTRIYELRWGKHLQRWDRDDMHIENVKEGTYNGQRHTGFIYDPDKSWIEEYRKKYGIAEEQLTLK